jgi:hypothetical protein
LNCPVDVHGIPERDGSGDESEATGAIALLLEAAVPDLSEAAKENGTREGVACLTLCRFSFTCRKLASSAIFIP